MLDLPRHRRNRANLAMLSVVLGVVLAGLAAGSGCAGPAPRAASDPARPPTEPSTRHHAAQVAISMVGTPYRYGGASPDGFDCSGLVVYSYAHAGIPGLPRTAAELEQLSRPVSFAKLEPGDLLFFRLSRKKTNHVAIYVGGRSFVHAPSSGKHVERVSFDHVFWGEHLSRAGRLEP